MITTGVGFGAENQSNNPFQITSSGTDTAVAKEWIQVFVARLKLWCLEWCGNFDDGFQFARLLVSSRHWDLRRNGEIEPNANTLSPGSTQFQILRQL